MNQMTTEFDSTRSGPPADNPAMPHIPTGPEHDRWALVISPLRNGDHALAALLHPRTESDLRPTLWYEVSGGDRVYLFRWPEHGDVRTRELAAGLGVVGRGGTVPDRPGGTTTGDFASGPAEADWLVDVIAGERAATEISFEELQALEERWRRERLTRHAHYVTTFGIHADDERFDWEAALTPGMIPVGMQDETLTRAARSLRSYGLPDPLALPILRGVVQCFDNDPQRDPWKLEAANKKWENVKRKFEPGRSAEYDPENITPGQLGWVERVASAGPAGGESAGPNEEPPDDDGPELRFMSLRQVQRTYRRPVFLVRNALLADAFKFTGGAEKTLKSWTMICEAVSVAAGVPLFGHEEFAVPKAHRVIIVTGEGGVDLYVDRVRHACAGLGVAFDDVADNLLVTEQVLPFDHPGFARGLGKAIDRYDPALIHVEPLYVYMGATAAQNAGNVYAMGPALARLRALCNGRAVHIGHHFTKAGRENLTLSSLTQSGAREFADHWCLLAHREEPDLDRQFFRLTVSVGARRGFGWTRDLDVELGPLDLDTLQHAGVPSFVLAARGADGGVNWRQILYEDIREHPGELTQKDLTTERNGVVLESPNQRRTALQWLVQRGLVRTESRPGPGGGRRANRYLVMLDVGFDALPAEGHQRGINEQARGGL